MSSKPSSQFALTMPGQEIDLIVFEIARQPRELLVVFGGFAQQLEIGNALPLLILDHSGDDPFENDQMDAGKGHPCGAEHTSNRARDLKAPGNKLIPDLAVSEKEGPPRFEQKVQKTHDTTLL